MNRRTFTAGLFASAAIMALPTITLAEETPSSGIAGNAHDLVPMGTGEGVEIVAVGGISAESVQVLIRNHTAEAVGITDVVGIARVGGQLVGTVESSFVEPYLVEAGGIAVGHAYFGAGNDVDPASEFELELETEEPRDSRRNVAIIEVEPSESGLVGVAQNTHDVMVEGPISIVAVFVDEAGTITGYASAYADKDTLEAGETTPFNASFYGDTMTDTYLIGASGWSY